MYMVKETLASFNPSVVVIYEPGKPRLRIATPYTIRLSVAIQMTIWRTIGQWRKEPTRVLMDSIPACTSGPRRRHPYTMSVIQWYGSLKPCIEKMN